MLPNRHTLITEFLAHGEADAGYSRHTVNAYRSTLNLFVRYMAEAHPEADVLFATAAQLIGYDQQSARTMQPRTRARNIAVLRSFYRWLVEERKLITRNPAAKLKPPEFNKSSRSCPVGAVRASLITAAARLRTEARSTLACSALGIMLYAGLRPADVCDLELGDVIFADEGAYVVVQSGKGRKRREVPLSDDLCIWLRAWLAIRSASAPYFFVHGPSGRKLSKYILRSLLAEVKTIAGIRDDHLTPHSLRHSCATTLYEQGVDLPVIQEILGHSHVETTRIYVHPTDKRKFAAVKRLDAVAVAPEVQRPRTKPVKLLRRYAR